MARQLRLHFASRRSNTDPLSESSHGEETEVSVSTRSPTQSLALNSVHLKVTPLLPENGILQQHSAVFIPRVNAGGCNKKSILQIALQPCGKPSVDLDRSTEDGDPAASEGVAGSGSDKGSCSSMASDAGYCSSNSIFEPEAPEKQSATQDYTSILRCKSKVPLRRCSSLVIFPKSPCSTPPASPDCSVAVPSLQQSDTSQHNGDRTCEGPAATVVSGHGLPKGGCSACNAAKNMVHFNKMVEHSSSLDRPNRHSSCVRLHFAHQRPILPTKGTSVHVGYPEAFHRLPHPQDQQNKKLYRSTSACLFSNKPPEKKKKACCSEKGQQDHCHRAIQRSFSLEVPYPNTGISCHVSNPKISSFNSPHVHIHLSPFCPNKLYNNVNVQHGESNAFTSPNEKTKVSIYLFVYLFIFTLI